MADAETLRLRFRATPPCFALLLALALAANAPALPWLAWPLWLLAVASRYLPAWHMLAAGRIVFLLGVYGVAAGLWGWFDAATLRLTLLLAIALKFAEARSARELALTGAASVVALGVGLMQLGELAGFLLASLAAWLLAAAFARQANPEALRPALASSARRLLLALPLAALLFLFFPRIPGPLWDIGLTFGLPLPVSIEKSSQGLGISTRLKPGQVQTGASDGAPVLVAEFENWVPPLSQLYWRGPVFYDFDGESWGMDPEYGGEGRKLMRQGWRSAAAFGEQLASRSQEVRYRIRLTPHGGLWLYGLDMPSRLTAESFVGPDWQVLSHQPVTQEISYDLASWLEWTASPAKVSDTTRQRALALPPEANPRLRALGVRLAGQGDTDSIARAALGELAQGGYRVRERFTPPDGRDRLDAFWFDSREGNAELYAGAFVALMRAAGVPTRLVAGFRGGKLMALTNYVVVKRGHAHAWVEILDPRLGWRRIDPVDVVAPQNNAAQAKPAPAPQAAPQRTPAARERAPAGSGMPQANLLPAATTQAASERRTIALPDLAGGLERWVFKLNGETQQNLLGGRGGSYAWAWLLLAAALGVGLMLAGRQTWAIWREHRRLPAPERHWRRACELLARKGLARAPSECPSRFALRIAETRPEWGQAATSLCQRYNDWRYGPDPQTSAGTVKAAARSLANRILAG